MAKKKCSTKNDSRGYATSAQPTATESVETKLPDKQHQYHLQSLLSIQHADAPSASASASASASSIRMDTSTKEFYKRMDSLNSSLVGIGFTERQVEQIVVGLASFDATSSGHSHVLALENALDWACLQLPTEELPYILTDAHLRDFVTEADSIVQVFRPAKSIHNNATRQFESTVPIVIETVIREKTPTRLSDQCKASIVNRFQYESDEEEEPELLPSSLSTSKNDAALSPDQVSLAALEKEIQSLKAYLNDEVANYMRSKHETRDLKKDLVKLEAQRNKLVARLNKLLASSESRNETVSVNQAYATGESLDDPNDNEFFSGMFNEPAIEDGPLNPKLTVSTEEPSQLNEGTDPFQQTSRESSIAKNWTGKTPKALLQDHCRKHTMPMPKFAKIPGSQNGCRVKISCKPTSLVLEQHGPFFDFKDAQEYVSTYALYKMYPDLPLYRVLPPLFSDLWKRWLKLIEDAKKLEKDTSTNEREERIRQLIALISARTFSSSKQMDKAVSTTHEKHAMDERKDKHDELSDRLSRQPSDDGLKLQFNFRKRQSKAEYLQMERIRVSLPIHAYRNQILETVAMNKVTVLHAETGAGKTTQCPQFILEQALLEGTGDRVSILCTQPRRISALSVAERVAEEMCERLGEMVGFQIRMESRRSSKTRLLYCTTGVVLRRLQDDPNLTGVTHVVVDEVHERQWQIDFLLIALRKIIQTTRSDLKVILMSATLDAQLFCSFFGNAPLVSVPGRTFPVANYFLEDLLEATGHQIEEDSYNARRDRTARNETQSLFISTRGGEKRQEVISMESQTDISDVSGYYWGYSMATQRSMDRVDEFVINYDLIEDVLTLLLDKTAENALLLPPQGIEDEAKPDGSVLIFLPGMGEIRALSDRLSGSRFFGNSSRFDIIPMHSSLSPQDQKRAFLKPRAGCQKIILATNIAETSVTIPDCVCVIDSGLGREVHQDKRFYTSKLVLDWCSRASARQRAGRAGRVQAGICCRLYSSRTHEIVMKPQAMPELQRVPLEEVCLSILAGKLANNCIDFLSQAPQPPSSDAVQLALKALLEMGAIDASEALTPLGHHLSKIPVHVRLAKMLLFGSLFGCLDKVLTIVGNLSCKSPFSNVINNGAEAQARHKAFQHESSDFLTSCEVWAAFRKACEGSKDRGRAFCRLNYLDWTTLMEIGDMRRQNLELVSQLGFVRSGNKITEEWLLTSEYNQHDKNDKIIHAVICAGLYPNVAHVVKGHADDMPLLLHKMERLYFHSSSINYKKKALETNWIVFHEKFGATKTTVSSTSPIQPFALLLFGGSVEVKHLDRKVLVDDWIELNIAAQTGVMLRELRRKLNVVLAEKMESPDSESGEIIHGIVKLLSV